jgi:hypothetical protein
MKRTYQIGVRDIGLPFCQDLYWRLNENLDDSSNTFQGHELTKLDTSLYNISLSQCGKVRQPHLPVNLKALYHTP